MRPEYPHEHVIKAHVHVIKGPMFAGKTTELIEQIHAFDKLHAGKNKIVVKPSKDERYDVDKIVSHNKKSYPAINTTYLCDLVPFFNKLEIKHVFIDEGHMYDDLGQFLRTYIGNVVIAGLDTDYKTAEFENMVVAINAASTITSKRSKCNRCGFLADYTARIGDEGERIKVGGAGSYYPCCKQCHPYLEDRWGIRN
jgi:thymidine kinase